MITLDYPAVKPDIDKVTSDLKSLIGIDFDGVVYGENHAHFIFLQNESNYITQVTNYWTQEATNGTGTTN